MDELDREAAKMEKIMIERMKEDEWITQFDGKEVAKEIKQQGWVELQGEAYPFKKLLLDIFTIFIPEEFELMALEDIERKYPFTQRADYIFSDETTLYSINFTKLEEKIDDEQFLQFANGVISNLRKIHPDMDILSEDSGELAELGYCYFDAEISSLDGKLYLFFGIVLVKNEMGLFSFSSPIANGLNWRQFCKAMLLTVEYTSEGVETSE
ncbi:hypothetical protein IW492_11430 [Enterococcus sp. BWB1-3]|uniref:hypothetical protein n=1 Tax=unclassified Enterococcus TaxID=2608891 RepID=UPI0019241A87|nr:MULTISPECIES: hypothetical protein [unclassified Enterococcus]MBL1229843.1 hypothetical protein [Enterococcus sp. BWB1-3]MCB5954250.1 hypothetical protein [Enterococcus sp. CWB-B31]